MNRICFVKEENEEDYRHTVEALDNVLISACMFYLQGTQNGILPTSQNVSDIDYVKGLLEEMKAKITD